jgi:integrase
VSPKVSYELVYSGAESQWPPRVPDPTLLNPRLQPPPHGNYARRRRGRALAAENDLRCLLLLVRPRSARGGSCSEFWVREVERQAANRAGVASLDMYSLRHTFASLGLGWVAGESAFSMSRMMGHSRSTLIEQVYAHSMQSGLARRQTTVALRRQQKLRRKA